MLLSKWEYELFYYLTVFQIYHLSLNSFTDKTIWIQILKYSRDLGLVQAPRPNAGHKTQKNRVKICFCKKKKNLNDLFFWYSFLSCQNMRARKKFASWVSPKWVESRRRRKKKKEKRERRWKKWPASLRPPPLFWSFSILVNFYFCQFLFW